MCMCEWLLQGHTFEHEVKVRKRGEGEKRERERLVGVGRTLSTRLKVVRTASLNACGVSVRPWNDVNLSALGALGS